MDDLPSSQHVVDAHEMLMFLPSVCVCECNMCPGDSRRSKAMVSEADACTPVSRELIVS